MHKHYDVVIIGGGAAGLICASQAGKRNRRTLLIEATKNVGNKIRISGGGRCNFTNLNISPNNFLSQNPSFAISALKRFTQHDFIAMVKKYKISYHEKTLGQLFCDNSSDQIINMLLNECKEGNVDISVNTRVDNIDKIGNDFVLETNLGNIKTDSLVIATGGLSIPKMGATDFGYKIAKKFDLNIIEPKPALVPLTLGDKMLESIKSLAGVSVFVQVKCDKTIFNESILFTHRGLSGPAILQISSYWKQDKKIIINMALHIDVFQILKQERIEKPKQDILTSLCNFLPKSLAIYILDQVGVRGKLADLSNEKFKIIATQINNWEIIPSGTEGFAKAEVTLGGIDTNEISSKTFEAKKVKNLYFIGEVLDVTGHLGGYNFQWAWSSGFSASQFV